MSNEEIFKLNELVQHSLNNLPVDELIAMTASELHEIWKQTTYLRDDNGKIVGQVEKWKKLDPSESPEEKKYVDKILSDDRFFKFPYVRKSDDGSISIDIGKMEYKQLSPHWQKENREAAEVAVELVLDNYVYLCNQSQREILIHVIGSAIHLLWKNRPANAYAKETELGNRYSNIPYEEKMKDVRHIYIAEKSIDIIAKKLGILDQIKKANDVNKKRN